ncbi:hypothetical protein BDM02DRAFT_3119531 [Thelephora ganbajun]|uniref:Uncharacterized protein n=1 Tax=Thelephora ganbajun TaxID=370292 RepID=A0ACB6Z9E9_THEGA|nr:hypothetical protein BDM02DRAFT_3119531 [Thelephora ganbajun]
MRMEEYTRLDLLLGASWKKALGVFDVRLTYSVKLRDWRRVVAEVYSDFAAKLPDAEPPTLATLGVLEGGRTEGSQ